MAAIYISWNAAPCDAWLITGAKTALVPRVANIERFIFLYAALLRIDISQFWIEFPFHSALCPRVVRLPDCVLCGSNLTRPSDVHTCTDPIHCVRTSLSRRINIRIYTVRFTFAMFTNYIYKYVIVAHAKSSRVPNYQPVHIGYIIMSTMLFIYYPYICMII